MSIAPISQFFILSPRGDIIISKDYRGDAVIGATDTFFRKVSWLLVYSSLDSVTAEDSWTMFLQSRIYASCLEARTGTWACVASVLRLELVDKSKVLTVIGIFIIMW